MRIKQNHIFNFLKITFFLVLFSTTFLFFPKLSKQNTAFATTVTIKHYLENALSASIDYDSPDTNGARQTPGWYDVGDRSTCPTYCGGPYRALYKFDVSSIPMSATITSATLSIYMTSFDGSYPAIGLYRITSDWTRTGVTWNNQPTYNGSAIATYTPTTYRSMALKTADITSTVAGWVNGTYPNYGAILISSTENNQWSRVDVSASEYSGYETYLTINYTDTSCSRTPDGSNQVTINSGTSCSFSNYGTDGNPKIDGIDVVGAGSTNSAILRVATDGSLSVKANQILNVGSIKIDKSGSSHGTITILGSGTQKGTIKIRQPVYVDDADSDNYGNLQTMAGTGGGTYVRLGSLTSKDSGDVSTTFACGVNTSYTTCKKCLLGTTVNVAAGKATFNGNEVTPSSDGTSCDNTSHFIASDNSCTGSSRWAACYAYGICDTAVATNYVDTTTYAGSGKVYTANNPTAVTASASYKCNTTYANAANACSTTASYYGCNGGGSCNTVGSTGTLYAGSGQVYTTINSNTVATANASSKCNTTYANAGGACATTASYYGCNTSGTCNTVGSTGTLYAGVNTVYQANSATAVSPSASYYCNMGYTYANDNCYAQSYYMGCNGAGSCTYYTTIGTAYSSAASTKYTGSALTTTAADCRCASCSIARCTGCTCCYRCNGSGTCTTLRTASCSYCTEY